MNLMISCYLAQSATNLDPIRKAGGSSWSALVDGPWAFVFGSITALILALFVWALFFRKRDPEEPLRRIIEAGLETDKREGGSGHQHRHRRRHRRRHRSSHRHRNPTLQETGGLPPRRPEERSPAM